MPTYTAISFAPVQGFIEKSRKLRDLYGASLILSYLSQKLVEYLQNLPTVEVISPALVKVQEGMPNRILVSAEERVERDGIKTELLHRWQDILHECRGWVQRHVPADDGYIEYHWSQRPDDIGQRKGEWEKWGSHTWELFWGYGDTPQMAMADLETRKRKRDWVGINWLGESSSLSGTDAITWSQLGHVQSWQGRSLSKEEQTELERFYMRLAWILDDLRRTQSSFPDDATLAHHFADEDSGKFITPRERLSIPELTKRLATLPVVARQLQLTDLDAGFRDIYRQDGYWTGWFMGDGDKVGDKLKALAERHADNPQQRDSDLNRFTELMRSWGQEFKDTVDVFSGGKGRVVYAGGDDFLGVLYTEDPEHPDHTPPPVQPYDAWQWLLHLPAQWAELTTNMKESLALDITYSVGFIWAGHSVPQRDILQHCREAEKRSKALGRDRLTIRILFNSGQHVQWTCPWDYLDILTKYCDRDGNTGSDANWNHLYTDWAALKARHAVQLQPPADPQTNPVSKAIAVELFNLYFDDAGTKLTTSRQWEHVVHERDGERVNDIEIMKWMDDLVNVGWQLCRTSNR